MSYTEPALPGAMVWMLRTGSPVGLEAMEKLEVLYGNALGG
jgi:hypothetical protein